MSDHIMRWVRTSDYLPKEGDKVLICLSHDPIKTYPAFFKEGQFDATDDCCKCCSISPVYLLDIDEVSHWAYITDPTKPILNLPLENK